MSDAELEVKSLQDLQTITTEAKKSKIKLAVIGGYAVQAYTRAYRFTKNIGFWRSGMRNLFESSSDPCAFYFFYGVEMWIIRKYSCFVNYGYCSNYAVAHGYVPMSTFQQSSFLCDVLI